jgi:drug/metabolite transporter (DMT)-like permease
LLFATANLFVILFARFLMPSELLTASKVLGILVSFIGVVIVFSGELLVAANSFWGGVALIIGAGSTGCAFVVAKKYSTSIKPVINVIVQTGIGALILLVTAAFFERQVPSQLNITSLLIIAYLSVAGSALPFVGMYWLFTRMEVTRVSLFNFIIPIVAVIFGWLILGERVGPNLLIGGALILVGVVLANQRDKKSLKT